jgi:hypothetical protein
MHPFKKKSQMTSEEFKTALREAGFGVAQGWIVDVSGECPGFATLPSFNKGVLNRNATLSKVLWERDAEIKRRGRRPTHRERSVSARRQSRGKPPSSSGIRGVVGAIPGSSGGAPKVSRRTVERAGGSLGDAADLRRRPDAFIDHIEGPFSTGARRVLVG